MRKFCHRIVGVGLVILCSCHTQSEPASRAEIGGGTQLNSVELDAVRAPRNDAGVADLLLSAKRRGGGLIAEEVIALNEAADRHIFSAYYALYLHHSIDGDPKLAEKWFNEGVRMGEPNLCVLIANREMTQAGATRDHNLRDRLLRKARGHLEITLKTPSLLNVSSLESVKSDIERIDQALKGL